MPARHLAPSLKMSTGHFLNARPPHWALLAQSESQKKSRKNKFAAFFLLLLLGSNQGPSD